MLIATSLVTLALLASPAFLPGRFPLPPPMLVSVTADAGVSTSLVERLLDEAALIWRAAGISIVWQRTGGPAQLHLTIGHARGSGGDEASVPLGWIRFDDDHAPQPEVYLSYVNASTLLDQSGPVVGSRARMPRAEVETLLGRAMGRALAHEIGHYLLASKAHTATGLMRAGSRASELFSPDRRRFAVDVQQRAAAVARITVPTASGL